MSNKMSEYYSEAGNKEFRDLNERSAKDKAIKLDNKNLKFQKENINNQKEVTNAR